MDIEFFMERVWPLWPLVLLLLLFSLPFSAWYSSCRSADVYNLQNGTSYTCSDFFWAADQINSQTQTIKLK